MSLLELQRRMAADVMRPLTADFWMQPETEDGASVADLAASYIKPNDRLSSFDRLEIYNRQYWFRAMDSLAEDFSALQAAVGAKAFEAIALGYLREHPSTSFTLRNLGAKLPDWLAAHPEHGARNHALALDVARLEWAYIDAFDGASAAALREDDFAGMTGDSTLSLQPHLQLLALGYPVDELVLAVHHANPSAGVVSNAMPERRSSEKPSLPALRRSATYLAVHRYDNTVYYRRLEREAYLLLSSLRRGDALGAAIGSAFANGKTSAKRQAAKVRQYFAHAAEMGWFTAGPPEEATQ